MGSHKLTVFLLLCTGLLQSRPAYSQRVPLITLTEKDVPLEKALEDIHDKTGYTYGGISNWTDISHNVSFSVRKATLTQVLDSCFWNQPLTYKIVNHGIAILSREQKNTTVHGRVFNEKNEPLEGATIMVKGENTGATSSRDDGTFTISTRYTGERLVISSVNYTTTEVQPEEGKEVNVHLMEKIGELVDAVVLVHTGYQDIRQRATTGSFDQLNNQLINRRVSPNILDRIDGVASSVSFNKNVVAGTNQSD